MNDGKVLYGCQRELQQDFGIMVEQDSSRLFVEWENGDFRLRPDSPAPIIVTFRISPAVPAMTIVNVIIVLCGSALATHMASLKPGGKVSVADIANAALGGGVAIGSACDKVSYHPLLLCSQY